jgi:hypothetical protein
MAFQHIKIGCCRASQRFNSLSIDINVKNRWSQSRNTKDFEDFCQRPVLGAEMGFVQVVKLRGVSQKKGAGFSMAPFIDLG